MISTLRDIRNLFLSSLYILYDNKEAEAIVRYYFEMKWEIPSHEFAIRPDKTFRNEEWQEIQNDLRRLQNGEPVQYVVGKSEFYGLTLRVNPLVLIPRPETEELVQLLLPALSSHPSSSNCEDAVGYDAITPTASAKGGEKLSTPLPNCEDAVGYDAITPTESAKGGEKLSTPLPNCEDAIGYGATSCRILDFCTGSGAIAIAIAKQFPKAEVFATDYSEDILRLAQQNAEDNHARVKFIQHDLLREDTAKLGQGYQAIVSNPPYIPQSHKTILHKNVVDFEPAEALFVPDEKPILFYERIALLGRELLADNGMLFFETHENYHNELESLLLQYHYQNIEKLLDLYGKPRFVTCKK